MARLPRISGRQAIRAFERLGWTIARPKRGKGSHVILVKEDSISTLSVPDHKEIAKGTLRSLIRSAGLTVDEFVDAV